MHMNDVLGDEGRKALDTCVKVKIYGRREDLQKYHWEEAVRPLRKCYVGSVVNIATSQYNLLRKYYFLKYLNYTLDKRDDGELYDIIDIHDALVNFDKVHFVEKYPNPGPRYYEWKKLIDNRRADIEREFQEAVDNPHGKEQYSWLVAQRKVRDCFAGNFAGDISLLRGTCKTLPIDPSQRLYSIFDIHDAVGFWDEAVLAGYQTLDYSPSYDRFGYWPQWRDFVREPRDEVERELTEAKAGNVRKEYSKDEAARRVTKCYVRDSLSSLYAVDHILPPKYDDNGVISESYDIFDIQKAIQCFDGKKCIQKYPDDEGTGTDELRKSIEKHSSSVEEEYKKAKSGLRRYSPDEAEQRIRGCFQDSLNNEADIFLANNVERIQPFNQTYDIFDVHKALSYFEEKRDVETQVKQRRSEELPESAKVKRDAVIEEYQKAKPKLEVYSWNEAERRVRDCFAGSLHRPTCAKDRDPRGFPYTKWDTDIFPGKEKESGVHKTQQMFDIFEIKKAIDYFDNKHLFDKYLDENDPESRKLKEQVDEARAQIEAEYAEATKRVEIEQGSGFVIHNHFIITNKHVIEDVLFQSYQKEICVSNSAIGELPCEVIHYDAGKDLALLYCPELNLSDNQISPLQLSTQSLLPGMQIFAFGFPMSHTGERALFVTGHVSGSKTTYSGPTLAVLNCSLNSGNSGGPILCWDKGQLKVVGVATQKHFKEILTLEERQKIEEIRKSLETSTICSVPDDDIKGASFSQITLKPVPGPSRKFPVPYRYFYQFDKQPEPEPRQIRMYLLTLKLYDALETHSQFNLSNALPGCSVVEFIKECIGKHSGEGKDELTEVVQWSEDHINILPSAERSAAQCCVQ